MADATLDLSDSQIDELLNQAETRLLEKQKEQNSDRNAVLKSTSDTAIVKNSKGKAVATKPTAAIPTSEKTQELSVRNPELRKSRKDAKTKADAGPNWFNMPKTDLTPELRKDLQLLKMRDVLDPKRFYKKDNSRGIPEYAQVGTMIPSRTDFFNSRMSKKERKRTLLEDVLETESATKRFKNKYGEIQATKASGKKGQYKKMMQKRYGRNYKG
ncbi:Fcf2-domain-containing protein [Xylariaceae sp. FL0255]|nr:Fcf2-domain-containing protein [Xylariaceae sp. FL0255]